MRLIFDSWRRSLSIFIFFAFLATALIAPIASDTVIPSLADYINNLAAIIQAKIALAEGQFPLRVAPLEQMGFRYPYYQFYSPSSFTFAALVYQWLTPNNPLIAFKITIWCALVLGGVYMYRLAYWLVRSRSAGLIASVVYLTAPYYIIVVNHLGNLNEAIALGLLPMVVYYTFQRYFYPTRDIILLQVAFSWYLLITTHVITFVYTSFFVGLLLLGVTLRNNRHWSHLFRTGIAYALGCLLAMWFIAPIAMLEKYFVMSDTFSNAAHFTDFSPLLSYLFFPAASFNAEVNNSALLSIHPSIGWPILIAVAIACYAFLNKYHSANKRADYWLPFLLMIFFIAFFLVWSPINIMRWLPKILLVGQYSWRLLGQVIWVGALLFAWALCWLFKNRLDYRHIVAGTLLIVLTATAWFPPIINSTMKLTQFIKNPLLIYNQNGYAINFNKNTQFVDHIDSMLLYSLMERGTLQLDTQYIMPYSLLKIATNPFISLQGNILNNLDKQVLTAEVNGSTVAAYRMKPGPFRWDIPLVAISEKIGKGTDLVIQFRSSIPKIKPPLIVPITRVMLSGFLANSEKLDVQHVMPNCHQQKTITHCKIWPSTTTHLLELPVLYYPKLLTIKLNGHYVSYQSVLYQNYLIAAVTPELGKMNIIDIEFHGLQWANQVSLVAWCLGMIVLLLEAGRVLLRKIR